MSPESAREEDSLGKRGVAAARHRLDDAILRYNRNSNLVERYRLAVARFHAAKESFQMEKAAYDAGVADRERWRAARADAAADRAMIQHSVREFVHRLRDEGLAPERALIAVKERLLACVSDEAPCAPHFEAKALESDVSGWAIAAYYDAA